MHLEEGKDTYLSYYKTYSIKNGISITNHLLESYISHFWSDIFKGIENSHLMLMCKVQFNDEGSSYRTLGHLRKVNIDDKELFIDYLSQRLTLLNDSYISVPISNITFSYIIKDGLATNNRKLLQDVSDTKLPFHSFNNMELPISMNPLDYGTIVAKEMNVIVNGEAFNRFVVTNGPRTYQIDVTLDGLTNTVRILGAIDLEWIDTRLSNDLEDSYTFKREIKKSTIYFMDGEKVLRKQILSAKPFKNLKVDCSLTNKFYTMDIETINQDGKLIPYLICAYNGSDYITSYSKNQLSLLLHSLIN